MIYTVTFNPAIDYVVRTGEMKVGVVNRTESEEIYFGGKGLNVSIILNELGIKLPADGDQKATDEYEIRLMQMVYILREMDSNRLASLLSRLQN